MAMREDNMSNTIRPDQATNSERTVLVVTLLAVAVTASVLDQLVKWIACSMLAPGRTLVLIPELLDLRLRSNPNGAFGLFAGFPPGFRIPLLLALPALAMAAITVYSIRTLGWSRTVSVSLGLVLGGALANLIDRLIRSEVVDFIHLHLADSFHWPTFNLADVAITTGSLILTATVIRLWAHRAKTEEYQTR